jgi:hypothetical protein
MGLQMVLAFRFNIKVPSGRTDFENERLFARVEDWLVQKVSVPWLLVILWRYSSMNRSTL